MRAIRCICWSRNCSAAKKYRQRVAAENFTGEDVDGNKFQTCQTHIVAILALFIMRREATAQLSRSILCFRGRPNPCKRFFIQNTAHPTF